ncbi:MULTISPECIES: glycine betaine ABC transporter substrate-binding protein [unclassified Microbacterium]|uniref:glycine betaine ABC transporter substrate-binding protein n=1 Tax=unclassified Microbacterium TaxID=2609290 RepID=UPI000EAA8477|nr:MULTISPECIES: glycine betaine ABC transporter substrate-binding protein [unclassified Microbacterium]MBT2484203.1 glycine betaine ABC transporter substrate-binding protein [Microbacterium sp. ISL-108]RKN67138.1 glycine betaine ABC transporter substrate-binding protein [Microbacterium sp. CGR2]
MKKKLLSIAALGVAASLTLAGCSGDGSGGTGGSGGDNASGSGDKGTITLGFLPSWTDGLSTAYLLEDQLEKLGYTVEMKTLTEAGALYTGLARGDVDMYPSAWPELTHADYMEQYGDDIEDLGKYYENAKLTIAVPEYSELNSIEDLKGKAADYDGKIIGIEPGAGLTSQTQKMLPEYGLDGEYELVTSSTAAMLTELKAATDKQEDIAVTLWRPFWANDSFGMKDLEDPKGAMGEAEGLHFLGHKGFADEFPEAAELIEQITLDDAQYGSLEDLVVNEYGEGKEAEAVDAWLDEHGDEFDWTVSE